MADGYGWQVGQVFALSRIGGDALLRDFNYTEDATFALDLANGQYDITVTLGDLAEAHDEMGVMLEGEQVDTVTTAAGQSAAHTYRVSVSDGQLNLRLFDLGGSDEWVMINGLDVVTAGPGIASAGFRTAQFVGSAMQFENQRSSGFTTSARQTRNSSFTFEVQETQKGMLLFKPSSAPSSFVETLEHDVRDGRWNC